MPARPFRPSAPSSQVNPSELALIRSIRARSGLPSGREEVRTGIGDDCAVLRIKPSQEIVVTTDLSLEQVHFRREWHAPESVGHRCLARGLSDLAAMGARPVAAFVSLAIPAALARSRWLDRFYDGLLALAAEYGVPLAGGDLAQSPELITADIVVVGAVPQGKALLRSGAKAGDAIYVTGALGGAAAELLAMQRAGKSISKRSAKNHPHLYPQPRLAVGEQLVSRKLASAAIDLSDGLSTELRHLCEESKLAAAVDAAAIPIHLMAELAACAGLADSALTLALHGGEDYELLFTADPSVKVPAMIAGVPVHCIGNMRQKRKGNPLISMNLNGRAVAVEAKGWEHFRKR